MELTSRERVIRGRIKMQQLSYFIYSLLFYSQFRMDDRIPTAAADIRGNMLFSPKFVEMLSDEHLLGILYHEVLHLVFGHHLQIQNYISVIFNIAADIVVNIHVRADGFTLPEGALICNWQGTFEMTIAGVDVVVEDCKGKNAIEIYEEIRRQLKDGGAGEGEGHDGEGSPTGDHNWDEAYDGFTDKDGNPVEGGKITPEEREKLREEMRNRIREAYNGAKMRGNMPAGIARAIGEILEPKLNWRWLLQKAVVATLPYDTSWSRPHKRSHSTGVYLPHVAKEDKISVIVSIDTSGSMSQEDLTDAISESVAMALQCRRIDMTFVICDAEIHRVYPVKNGSIEKIKAIEVEGGGGTSHIPVYEWVEKNHPECKLLVNFTDGYTDFPEGSKIPSMWVLTKNSCPSSNIPFGKVIEMYK